MDLYLFPLAFLFGLAIGLAIALRTSDTPELVVDEALRVLAAYDSNPLLQRYRASVIAAERARTRTAVCTVAGGHGIVLDLRRRAATMTAPLTTDGLSAVVFSALVDEHGVVPQ